MDELEYKKKYIKYKTKYLNLLIKNKIHGGDENDDPNSVKSVKPNPWSLPNPLLKKSTQETAPIVIMESPQATGIINNPSILKTPTKIKQKSTAAVTPIIMAELTPSKAVNKKQLCHVFDDISILRICTDNNFIARFVDKPYIHLGNGDECLLELYTRLDPNNLSDPYILIGHITVHKGISISRSKSLHFRSDYLTDFLIVITLKYNEDGKIFIVGENNKGGTTGFDYLKLKPEYVNNLGERIENVVMKILEYLNTIKSQILFNP